MSFCSTDANCNRQIIVFYIAYFSSGHFSLAAWMWFSIFLQLLLPLHSKARWHSEFKLSNISIFVACHEKVHSSFPAISKLCEISARNKRWKKFHCVRASKMPSPKSHLQMMDEARHLGNFVQILPMYFCFCLSSRISSKEPIAWSQKAPKGWLSLFLAEGNQLPNELDNCSLLHSIMKQIFLLTAQHKNILSKKHFLSYSFFSNH